MLSRLAFLALVAGLLPSCNTFRGFQYPKRAISLDSNNAKYSSYMSPTRYDYVNQDAKNYFRRAYEDAPNDEAKQLVRNQIAKEMAALVDENHDIYHEALRRNVTKTNVISDFITLGLTSSAAITTGVHAKSALSTIATATNGFGASVTDHVLQQQTLSALLKAMTVRKERIYAEMKTHFGQETSRYGLEDVIRDLGRYWQGGLLIGGLAELDQMTSNKVAKVNEAKADAAGGNKSEAEEAAEVLKAASTTE